MKLHLIKHSESEGNAENILQGHRDYHLTLRGVRQARYLRDVIFETYNNYDVFSTTYPDTIMYPSDVISLIFFFLA